MDHSALYQYRPPVWETTDMFPEVEVRVIVPQFCEIDHSAYAYVIIDSTLRSSDVDLTGDLSALWRTGLWIVER